MPRDVYARHLRDARRALIGWAIGLSGVAFLMMSVYPAVQRQSAMLQDYMKHLPKAFAAFVGHGADFTTPAGYLNAEVFSFTIPVMLLVFSIGLGSRLVAGERESGTLDLTLSAPVGRSRVIAEACAALTTLIFVLCVVLWGSLVAGARIVGMDIGAARLAEAVTAAGALALAFGLIALAVGCFTGRGAAAGASAGLALVTWIVNSLADLVHGFQRFRPLSPFFHTLGQNPVANGLGATHVAAMLLLTALAIAGALTIFERRDITV